MRNRKKYPYLFQDNEQIEYLLYQPRSTVPWWQNEHSNRKSTSGELLVKLIEPEENLSTSNLEQDNTIDL